jgi:hypothetical protein
VPKTAQPQWYVEDRYTGTWDDPPAPEAYGLPMDFRPSQVANALRERTGRDLPEWPR